MLAAVNMRAKLRSLLAKLAVGGERKHLKAAAVGQYRPLPAVEAVQPARLFDNVKAGTQVEVVSIAEDNLGVDVVPQFADMHRLNRPLGAYGHENGRFDAAVRRSDNTRPRFRGTVCMYGFIFHHF